jgi:hypothetical protein
MLLAKLRLWFENFEAERRHRHQHPKGDSAWNFSSLDRHSTSFEGQKSTVGKQAILTL